MLDPKDMVAFDIYFASVTSMQFHPGSGTKEHKTLTLEECRDIALQMVALRRNLVE
jgi:hypothetical protein